MARPEWAVVTRNDIDTFMRCDGKIIQEVQSVVDGVLARMPASAVEEAELTDQQCADLWEAFYGADSFQESRVLRKWLAEHNLRIVRDAKPAASFIRRAPPLNLPDDDGFCSVGGLAVDLGLYKSSDAKPVPADDTAERERDIRVDQLGKKVLDIMEDMEGLHARVVALESRNPELKIVAAERTFTEAEVREAIDTISCIAACRVARYLGIDMEAAK